MATAPATVASAVWDLDNDGSFGDHAGLTASMPLPQVEQLVCTRECSTGRPVPGDRAGHRRHRCHGNDLDDSANRTSTSASIVGPHDADHQARRADAAFTVEHAVTTSGFAEPIDLTMVGLPAGVTAQFRAHQDPAGTVVGADEYALAASLTGVDEVDLTVRGTSAGGTVRDVSPKVSSYSASCRRATGRSPGPCAMRGPACRWPAPPSLHRGLRPP